VWQGRLSNGFRRSRSMSKQYHWVVVYDEDWGAFMVDDAEPLLDEDRLVYDKSLGKFYNMSMGSPEEKEYQRLEEILAYQITRLDIPKKVG